MPVHQPGHGPVDWSLARRTWPRLVLLAWVFSMTSPIYSGCSTSPDLSIESDDRSRTTSLNRLLEISSGQNPAPASYTGRPVVADWDNAAKVYVNPLTALTAKIRATRTSDYAPFTTILSGCETSWVGPTKRNPFLDCEFVWNFGDGRPSIKAPMCVVDLPEAGTLGVTLTVNGWNGSTMISSTTSTILTDERALVQVGAATTGGFTLRVFPDRPAPRAARFFRSAGINLWSAGSFQPTAAGWAARGSFRINSITTVDQDLVAVWKKNSGNRGGRVGYVGATKKLRFYFGSDTNYVESSQLVDTGIHHFVAWIDPVAVTLNLIVDGVPVSAASTVALNTSLSAIPLTVGCSLNSTDLCLNAAQAEVDDLTVWGRSLTSAEATALSAGNTSAGPYDQVIAATPSLNDALGAWGFDQERGPFLDDSGHGNVLSDVQRIPASNNKIGVAAVGPLSFPAGGVETAPIAVAPPTPHAQTADTSLVDLNRQVIRNQAVAAAVQAATRTIAGLETATVRPIGYSMIEFGGTAAGRPFAVCPGVGSNGFNGTIYTAAEGSGGGSASELTALDWPANWPTHYFDSNATANGVGGLGVVSTEAEPFNSAAMLATKLAVYGGGWLIKIKAGSTFQLAASVNLGLGNVGRPLVIRSYGTGTRPVLIGASSAAVMMICSPADTESIAGITIDGIVFQFAKDAIFTVTPPLPAGVTLGTNRGGVHLQNSEFLPALSANKAITIENKLGGDNILFNCRIIRGAPVIGGDSSHNAGFYGASGHDLAVAGCELSGGGGIGGGSEILSHHIYSGANAHCLFGDLDFGDPAGYIDANGNPKLGSMNLCIKIEANDGAVGLFMVLDRLDAGANQTAIGMGRQNSDDPIESGFDNIVVQNSQFYKRLDGYESQSLGMQLPGAYRVTVRDCDFFKNYACSFLIGSNITESLANFPPETGLPYDRYDIGVYRNNFYLQDNDSGPIMKDMVGLEFLDNKIVGDGATDRQLLKTDFGKAQAVGAHIDRNTYYTPNRPPTFRDVLSTTTYADRTLADWRAAPFLPDATVSYADPGWTDPRAGDFKTDLPTTVDPLIVIASLEVGEQSILLGSVITGGLAPYEVRVQRTQDPDAVPESFQTIGSFGTGSTFSDDSVDPGSTYWYRIEVIDREGTISYSENQSARIPNSSNELPDPGPSSNGDQAVSYLKNQRAARGLIANHQCSNHRAWRGGWYRNSA